MLAHAIPSKETVILLAGMKYEIGRQVAEQMLSEDMFRESWQFEEPVACILAEQAGVLKFLSRIAPIAAEELERFRPHPSV